MSTLNNPPAVQVSPAEASAHNLKRVIILIDELVALMEQEAPLLEARKRLEHAELLKHKQRLTLDYRASMKAFAADPTLLRDVPATLRAEARAAADRLAEACNRNSRTLRAIIAASQNLVQSIVAIVKDQVLPKAGYNNIQSGNMTGSYSPTCKPVTVYQSV